MTRREFATIAGLGLTPLRVSRAEPSATSDRFEHVHATMGTKFRFVVYARDEAQATGAVEDATRRLDALNASLSDYVRTSEVSRLSADSGLGHWRLVPDDLWDVLSYGNRLAAQTEGAFDMTVGPMTRLWHVARRSGKLPSQPRLAEALAATGHAHLEMDAERRRARLTLPGMRLDLGGIAKGYAVDATLDVLVDHGITDALVDGGGDLRALGSPPHTAGWMIAVDDLETSSDTTSTTALKDLAMATSGDLYQSVEIDGRKFSHIVNPRTGLGLEYRRLVTVISPSAMIADALASAISVLSISASRNLLETHYPESSAKIVTLHDSRLEKVVLGQAAGSAILRR
jgi:thiamine biosynthesis lipoprotein